MLSRSRFGNVFSPVDVLDSVLARMVAAMLLPAACAGRTCGSVCARGCDSLAASVTNTAWAGCAD
eukprot:598594-Prymnesium_polylepis.1